MTRYKIGAWIIAMLWILLVTISILLVKSCRIKYEIIPQTVQIESYTYADRTHEYVKEFSYYDKKRNIHTITSDLFIDPNCSCGVDYNYMKDGDRRFNETCGQLTKLSTKQRYRIESNHLWYTSNALMIFLTICVIILGLMLTITGTIKISDRLAYYHNNEYYGCYGCNNRCCKNAECIWGKLVNDKNCERINKFFGF
jgi:hypothetical protein